MNIHEYQAKDVLARSGVPVPGGMVASTPEEAVEVAKIIQEKLGSKLWVVKAQIHAGGRGKGGGVKIAKSLEEVTQFANDIIGMQLVTPQTSAEGKLVQLILVGYVDSSCFKRATQAGSFCQPLCSETPRLSGIAWDDWLNLGRILLEGGALTSVCAKVFPGSNCGRALGRKQTHAKSNKKKTDLRGIYFFTSLQSSC